MTVIAMPREMGSLGKDVALEVAEQLGLDIVHHELVERDIAGRLHVGESTVHKFLEGTPSLWERWKVDPEKLYQYTAEEMLTLANKGNILIRGWGAVSLLRRVPHVLCVRICAPMEFRAKVMKERLFLDSMEVARREITKNDEAHVRSAQIRRVSNWTDSTNFDLVLNTERVPISECAQQIKKLATSEAFAETQKSKIILSDMLLETRIKNTMALKENGNLLSHGLDVYVNNGEAVITGTVADEGIVEKAFNLAKNSGATRVEKHVTVISSSHRNV